MSGLDFDRADGLRLRLALRDRVRDLVFADVPRVDVLLLRDPGGEDVRVAMLMTLGDRHTSITLHRACLG